MSVIWQEFGRDAALVSLRGARRELETAIDAIANRPGVDTAAILDVLSAALRGVDDAMRRVTIAERSP